MVNINANINGVAVSANVTGNETDGYTITFTAPPSTAGHTQHVGANSMEPFRSREVNDCFYLFTPSTNWGNVSSPSQVAVTLECSAG